MEQKALKGKKGQTALKVKKLDDTKSILETPKDIVDVDADSNINAKADAKIIKSILKPEKTINEGHIFKGEVIEKPKEKPKEKPVEKPKEKPKEKVVQKKKVKVEQQKQQPPPISLSKNDDKPESIVYENDYREIIMNYNPKKNVSIPVLTDYEIAFILGKRATQIAYGSIPLIEVKAGMNHIQIAEEELKQKKTPYIIKRTIGNKIEYYKICDMVGYD
jgi:DNA-directed RNA polymerase subunit K/omega